MLKQFESSSGGEREREREGGKEGGGRERLQRQKGRGLRQGKNHGPSLKKRDFRFKNVIVVYWFRPQTTYTFTPTDGHLTAHTTRTTTEFAAISKTQMRSKVFIFFLEEVCDLRKK